MERQDVVTYLSTLVIGGLDHIFICFFALWKLNMAVNVIVLAQSTESLVLFQGRGRIPIVTKDLLHN